MTAPEDLYTPASETVVRATVTGYMQASGLDTTAFVEGDPEQQILEAMVASGVNQSALVAQMNRGYASLDTATDARDPDPFDPTNESAPPTTTGFLSNIGAGTYGTPRILETFATGTMTITNASGAAIYIAPEQVTFTSSVLNPDGNYPTYRNSADAAVYTNPDGTATIANGDTLDVSIVADEQGTNSNAGAGDVSLTTVLGTGVTATNAAAILAQDRESAEAYRARCRTAPAMLSLNGPADAYRFIALSAMKNADTGAIFIYPPFGDGTTGIGIDNATDGNFVLIPNATGESLGITRVYVSEESATGTVTVYIAGAAGDPGAQVLTDFTALINVLYWPECTSRLLNRATNVTVNIVATIKAKAGAGVSTASIEAAADAALEASFPTYDIGGFDRVAGAGTLYKQELESEVNGAHVAIYKVTMGTPAGDTALALGQVAVLGTTTWTVTIV